MLTNSLRVCGFLSKLYLSLAINRLLIFEILWAKSIVKLSYFVLVIYFQRGDTDEIWYCHTKFIILKKPKQKSKEINLRPKMVSGEINVFILISLVL